jgi:fucose permease
VHPTNVVIVNKNQVAVVNSSLCNTSAMTSGSTLLEMQHLPCVTAHPLSPHASRLFVALRCHPSALGCLGRIESRDDADVCRRVILDILFPPGPSPTPRPFSLCLSSLFACEIAACTDLRRLLRENSLACVVSSGFFKSSVPQHFLAATMMPVFDLALQHPSLQATSQAYDIDILVSTLNRVTQAIRNSCSIGDGTPNRLSMPEAVISVSRAIANALKAHPMYDPPQTLSVESAVASVVFLRFIVPYIVSLGVGRPLPQARFFMDMGTVLQKLCSSSGFGPGHRLEVLNGKIVSLYDQVREMLRGLAACDVASNGDTVDSCSDPHDDADAHSNVGSRDLFVFASLLATCSQGYQSCAHVNEALVELTTHPTFSSLQNSSPQGDGIHLELNQSALSRMLTSAAAKSRSGGSSKRLSDMTNDDLILRLRALETENETKLQGSSSPEIDTSHISASPAVAAVALPRAALVSQCLQFFWMGFAWPSMGAVLPRIREMFQLNYAEGTLVFGIFACGLMLGCCAAFDEGRAAFAKFFALISDKVRKNKPAQRHVEFQDEDETGGGEELVDLREQTRQQPQEKLRGSFLRHMLRDTDKMKLLASVTLTVIGQVLMGTVVHHAPYTFCLGVWFIMGLANTGLNIFSGIVVSRLAPASTTAIFAWQGPSYGVAAMLASPLAAAIMIRMDNDFSWFYLLQAALGCIVIVAITLSDFPFAAEKHSEVGPRSMRDNSNVSSHLVLLLKDRRFAFAMLSSFFYWGLDGVLSQWITTVLLDQGSTLSFSSQVLSLLWAGVLVGRGIFAIASVSIYRGTPLRNSVLMITCTPPAVILAAVIALSSLPAAVLLTSVFFYGLFLAPMDALLRGVTGALFKHPSTGQTNTPFTILFFACNGSLLLFTPLAGIVIQATGSGRAGLCVGVVCGVCVLCMASCLWLKLK